MSKMADFTSIPELDMVRRMPRLGKIGLGVKMPPKREGGREYPKEVDYFVLDPPSDDATRLQTMMFEKFRSVYGPKPKHLDILFPAEDRTAFFPQAYKLYAQSGLKCKGNGECASRLGALFEEGSPERAQPDDWHVWTPCTCDRYEDGECKRMGNLMVILPLVSMGGVWQIDTSSFHSIVNINNEVAMYENMLRGHISWLARVVQGNDGKPHTETAFILTREPQSIQYDGKTQVHWTMHVRLRRLSEMTFEDVMALRDGAGPPKAIGLPSPSPEQELIEGNQAVPTTTEDVHPETVDDDSPGSDLDEEPVEQEANFW